MSARSENRSSVESQNAPNSDTVLVRCATLPSMKSKMLATSMMTNASMNFPKPSAHAAPTLTMTPMSVSVFGWMCSLTHALMIARSGNMQIFPMSPVNVVRGRGARPLTVVTDVPLTAGLIMEGSDTERRRDIVAYGHPRTQGTDRPVARAARSLSVLQRGRRHDLCGQGARAPRPRAQLSGWIRLGREARRAARRNRAARGHRHRLGRRGARARKQPD